MSISAGKGNKELLKEKVGDLSKVLQTIKGLLLEVTKLIDKFRSVTVDICRKIRKCPKKHIQHYLSGWFRLYLAVKDEVMILVNGAILRKYHMDIHKKFIHERGSENSIYYEGRYKLSCCSVDGFNFDWRMADKRFGTKDSLDDLADKMDSVSESINIKTKEVDDNMHEIVKCINSMGISKSAVTIQSQHGMELMQFKIDSAALDVKVSRDPDKIAKESREKALNLHIEDPTDLEIISNETLITNENGNIYNAKTSSTSSRRIVDDDDPPNFSIDVNLSHVKREHERIDTLDESVIKKSKNNSAALTLSSFSDQIGYILSLCVQEEEKVMASLGKNGTIPGNAHDLSDIEVQEHLNIDNDLPSSSTKCLRPLSYVFPELKFNIYAIANIPKSLKSRPVINLDECISESDLEETGIQIPIQLSLIDITGIGPYFNSKASDLVDKNSFSQASHVTCSSFPAVNNLDDGDYVKITNANAKVDSNALFDKVIQALWINHQVPYYPTEIIIVNKAKGSLESLNTSNRNIAELDRGCSVHFRHEFIAIDSPMHKRVEMNGSKCSTELTNLCRQLHDIFFKESNSTGSNASSNNNRNNMNSSQTDKKAAFNEAFKLSQRFILKILPIFAEILLTDLESSNSDTTASNPSLITKVIEVDFSKIGGLLVLLQFSDEFQVFLSKFKLSIPENRSVALKYRMVAINANLFISSCQTFTSLRFESVTLASSFYKLIASHLKNETRKRGSSDKSGYNDQNDITSCFQYYRIQHLAWNFVSIWDSFHSTFQINRVVSQYFSEVSDVGEHRYSNYTSLLDTFTELDSNDETLLKSNKRELFINLWKYIKSELTFISFLAAMIAIPSFQSFELDGSHLTELEMLLVYFAIIYSLRKRSRSSQLSIDNPLSSIIVSIQGSKALYPSLAVLFKCHVESHFEHTVVNV